MLSPSVLQPRLEECGSSVCGVVPLNRVCESVILTAKTTAARFFVVTELRNPTRDVNPTDLAHA